MRKKLVPIVVMVVLMLVSVSTIKAQSDFEGKITYTIQYTKVPAMLQGYESMLPSQSTTYIKGSKSRTEVPMAMGGDQVVIFDKESYTGTLLMDILGSKMAVVLTKEEIQKEEENYSKPKVTYYKDYKTIVGYKCQKAVVEVFNSAGDVVQSNTVYFTDKIPNITQNFGEIKGVALEFTTDKDGVASTLTATSVLKQKLPETLFQVPDGYEMKTVKELEEMSGGGDE